MPVHFIKKGSDSIGTAQGTSQPPNVASIKVDPTKLREDIVYNAEGTRRVVPQIIPIKQDINANSVTEHFFIADDNYIVVGVSEIHSAQGGTGATFDIQISTGTTAPGSGTSVLASAPVDVHTQADNTVQSPALSATAANLALAAGNSLDLVMAGTLTGLVGTITVYLRRT